MLTRIGGLCFVGFISPIDVTEANFVLLGHPENVPPADRDSVLF
jgi:hypothetical protein